MLAILAAAAAGGATGIHCANGTILRLASTTAVIEACPMRPSEALALHRAALRDLLRRYGFRRPCIFGSVLTRTDTEESDLDVLVEPMRGTTLFTLASLEDEARKLTGVRVSVLTPGFLSPKFRDKVLHQAQPL